MIRSGRSKIDSASVANVHESSRLTRAAAFVALVVVLLPLVGMAFGLLSPPEHPLTGPVSLGAIAKDAATWELLGRTLALGLVVAPSALILGAWLAWVEARYEYPGRTALAVMDLLPLATPSYLLAAATKSEILRSGLGQAVFGSEFRGFWPAALVLAVITTPYVQLLVGAACHRLSAAEEEAARTLGCGPTRVFLHIVLPRLRSAFVFSFLIVLLYVMSDFGAVAVLDCRVLTWRLYQAVNHQQLAKAIVLGGFLLAAVGPFLIASRYVQGRNPRAVQVSNARPVERQRAGLSATFAAYLVHVFVIGFGVVFPFVTLLGWVNDGVGQGVDFAPMTEPVITTVVVALVCATLIVAMALPAAWLAERARGREAAWVETGVWLSTAMPGVLLSFGLLLFALAISRLIGPGSGVYAWMVGSGVLLVFGYSARFLAEAFGTLKTAVSAFDPRQDEAARILGASPFKRFRRVMVPSLRPGLSAAFVLIALALVKELPVTLLLGGAMGLHTLAFRVFDRYQEAFLSDAGLAGLAMMALTLLLVVAGLRWRRHV